MLLNELRKGEKLTQQEVADELNIKKSTYCLYEKGKREPSLINIVKLSNLFACSIDLIVKALIKAQEQFQNKKGA